jgi:hypothetical protein
MDDHGWSASALGFESAWPGGISDGRGCSWRGGPSASGGLDVNEAPWEAARMGWLHRAPQSASQVFPVKSALGAFPLRLPLLSR